MSLCISSVLNIGVQKCWMYQVLQLLKLLFICVVSNDNVVIMIWLSFLCKLAIFMTNCFADIDEAYLWVRADFKIKTKVNSTSVCCILIKVIISTALMQILQCDSFELFVFY